MKLGDILIKVSSEATGISASAIRAKFEELVTSPHQKAEFGRELSPDEAAEFEKKLRNEGPGIVNRALKSLFDSQAAHAKKMTEPAKPGPADH